MKTVLIAAAVSALLMAPQAFAQAHNFAGFGIGLNGSYATTSTEPGSPGGGVKFGEDSQNASLQAAYGFVVGNSAVMGLGVSYTLGDMKAGSFSSGGNRYEMKGQDMYAVYIEPGYALSSSTLIYVKFAYMGMKGEVSGGGTTASENFDGVGYGLGVRAKLDKNLFWQVELAQTDYNAKDIQGASFKPSATIGTVGIGYQF